MERRTFLQRLLTVVCLLPREALPQVSKPISVRNGGAVGDGSHDDASAIERVLNENPTGSLLFPDGTYRLSRTVRIEDFGGEVTFSANARLVLDDFRTYGLIWARGRKAVIRGLRIGCRNAPTERINKAPAVFFARCVDFSIENCIVDNAWGAGLIFDDCIRPRVVGARVANTMADGIHFANCESGYVADASTDRTGDDGVAFVNYKRKGDLRGGLARGIRVTNSRGRGIAVVGQSDVLIDQFDIEMTSVSGIYCASEHYYDTRVPENVVFQNGRIRDAGMLLPRAGNQFGIEVDKSGKIGLVNIQTHGSYMRGISVNSPAASVRIQNVLVSAPMNGEGAVITANSADVEDLTVEKTEATGIVFAKCNRVTARRLNAVSVSRGRGLKRAVWFEGNAEIDVDGISVDAGQDEQGGRIVGLIGIQQGHIRSLAGRAGSKSLPQVLENRSAGVRVTLN